MSSDFTHRPGPQGLSRAPRPPGNLAADTPITSPGGSAGPGRPCPPAESRADDLPAEEDPPDFPESAEAPLPRPPAPPRRRHLAKRVGVCLSVWQSGPGLAVGAGRVGGPSRRDLARWQRARRAGQALAAHPYLPGRARFLGLDQGRKTVLEAGGFSASHPAKLPPPLSALVVALPGWGAGLTDTEPVGFVIYSEDGEDLTLYQGKNKKAEKKKVLVVADSQACFLNKWALERILDGRATFVWKVEGPTDMLALQALIPADLKDSHVVLTTAFGAVESVQPWMMKALKGKKIGLIGDCDVAGAAGVSKWISSLQYEPVAEYRAVVLPYPNEPAHGKDLRDWVKEGHSYAELLKLYEAAPLGYRAPGAGASIASLASAAVAATAATLAGTVAAAPATAAVPAAPGAAPVTAPPPSTVLVPTGAPPTADFVNEDHMLRQLQLHVLGHFPDMSVEIYSLHTRQTHRIPNAGKLSMEDLVLLGGTVARDLVWDGKEDMPDRYRLAHVKKAIAVVAGTINLVDAVPIGQGLWKTDDDFVLINGSEGVVVVEDIAGVRLEPIMVPRCGQHIIDFSGEPWCNLDVLRQYLVQAHDRTWCQAVYTAVEKLFRAWKWRNPSDASVGAALVGATWMQTTWTWRPIVMVSGPANTGKTTFFNDLLARFFGGLSLCINKPTEAAVRQFLKNHASALLLDECEQDTHRVRLFEMLRATSRGGEILRGSADQRGRKYRIQHLPWMAAIESGLSREADATRVIHMELERYKPGSRLVLPGGAEIADLGLKFLAVVLRHMRGILERHVEMKDMTVPNVHPRMVETYAVAAALRAEIFNENSFDAADMLREWLNGREQGLGSTHDEQTLLNWILDSMVRCHGGQMRSVVQLLQCPQLYAEWYEQLSSHGVILVCTSETTHRNYTPASIHDLPVKNRSIFMNPIPVGRFLLDRTRWANLDIVQLLLRLPGAKRERHRIAGTRRSGVSIPCFPWLDPGDAEISNAQRLADLQDP
jgi:hypothetical protein